MAAERSKAELEKTKPFASPAIEAYLNLLRTADQLQHEFRRLFKAHGITEPQYNVLRILRGAGPDGLPCLAIGERMVTRVPDVTRLLDRLENAALVSRERSNNDRRVVVARVTRKGLRVLDALDEPTLERHEQLLGHLAATEIAELNRLLEKARDAHGSP